MKKAFFSFVLLMLLALSFSAPAIYAQTKKITPTLSQASTEAAALDAPEEGTQSAKDEYALPYPGILPDNPLYFLKTLRDKIILMLISDPVKEAEFNLLTSDKRIYAAQLLADKKKGDLAVTTLSKSNNYLENSLSSASEAKKMGKDIDIVLHTMKKAIKKHQEVLSMMERVLPKNFSGQIQNERNRMIGFEKSVDSILPK